MYFLWLRDRQTGPYSLEEVRERWNSRAIHGEILYWQEGLPDWTPLHAIHHVIEDAPARMVLAGIARRTGAFLCDALLLGAVGYLPGTAFFDFYLRLGPSGILIGLAICLAYFGLLDATPGGGQTPGKRAFGLRVVNASGDRISPARSVLRYLVFSFPFWIAKALSSGLVVSFPLEILLSTLGAIVAVALLYLYLFNRRTRQSLHDLAAGTYVIRTSSPPAALAPRIWRGHGIAVGILVILALGFSVCATAPLHPSAHRLLAVRRALLAVGNIRTATVTENTSFAMAPAPATRPRICTVNAFLKARPRSMETEADAVADLVLKTDPTVAGDDSLAVTVAYGYDLGIGWSSVSESYARPPAQWKDRFDLSQ